MSCDRIERSNVRQTKLAKRILKYRDTCLWRGGRIGTRIDSLDDFINL